MSSQGDGNEMTSPRKATSARRSTQTKRKELESRNTKSFIRSKRAQKEKHKPRNTTKSDCENIAMQRVDSGVCALTAKRSMSRKPKGTSTSQDAGCDISSEFRMLQLHCDESNEDYLSMISINSRPSSRAALDLQEELFNENLKDDDKLESLETFSTSESRQIRITTDENNQSGISTNLVSNNNGSPRLQITQLEDHTMENLDKLEKGNLESSNPSAQEVELGKESESEGTTKSKIKTAWELNDKFLLTTDFPAEVWDDKKTNKKSLSKRKLSSDLLSASFPPLSAVPESRRGSFPISFSNNWFSSPKTPPELPALSGKQCKVQLPSSFPGISSSPPSDSESESSDDDFHSLYWEQGQIGKRSEQKPLKNYLEIPPGKQAQKPTTTSTRASPPSSSGSRSPMASSEQLSMKAASTEYLAARMVTQLNCAFKETVGESEDEEVTTRSNCVTPNLMRRRHSALFFRPNTSSCFDEKAKSLILPSVPNECSKSLPNLSSQDKTKRMFVTFDKASPHVKVVNLKGKSDLARKCRLINRRLTNEDSVVKAMLEEKVHKKTMVKKWVFSSAQGI